MSKPLTLALYQALAAKTDRTRIQNGALDLPLLGLFGEVGSLLSEVKKKQRDARSYLGYEGKRELNRLDVLARLDSNRLIFMEDGGLFV